MFVAHQLVSQHRFIRALPGRARIEVHRLKGNKLLANAIQAYFERLAGIVKVMPNVNSGRLLVLYEEGKLSLQQILLALEQLEQGFFQVLKHSRERKLANAPETHTYFVNEMQNAALEAGKEDALCDQVQEVAVTQEGLEAERRVIVPIPQGSIDMAETKVSGDVWAVPRANGNRMPLPLTLSVGGLGILGLKRVLSGPSPWARSPAAFKLAAAVAAVSGYPLLKRGVQRISGNRWNTEVVLGVSALTLALIRQNLVVLAGLGILHYLKWQRSQAKLKEERSDRLWRSPEIRQYSERAGKLGLALAGTAWALTGEPLTGLGVLLAANPRVATLPAEHAWDQAELEARQQGYYLPAPYSLARLARVKTVVWAEPSPLGRGEPYEVECLAQAGNGEDERKIWQLAVALMNKTQHPWQEEVVRKARAIKGSVRTAFKVEQAEQGVRAEIHGAQVLMGSLKYLEQHGVNCDHYLLEVRRMQRTGFEVLCLAADGRYLGVLRRSREGVSREFGRVVNFCQEYGLHLSVLSSSPGVNREDSSVYQQGAEVLLIAAGDEVQNTWPQGLEVPVLTADKLFDLRPAMALARRTAGMVRQQLGVARTWNLMGALLAVFRTLSAPVVNLVSDAVTLLLLARGQQKGAGYRPGPQSGLPPAQAASEKDSVSLNERHFVKQTQIPSRSNTAEVTPWHALTEQEIAERFGANKQNGLTGKQVEALRQKYGLNMLEQRKPTPWILSYLGQFKEFTTLIVLGISALALLSGDLFDGLAMGAILLANAAVGTFQERKAEKVIEALNQFQPSQCRVIRDKERVEVQGTELVPGDLVIMEAGDRIPADLRLIRSWNLEVNEAALTGESLPVAKSPEILDRESSLAERKNMLYMGTDVTRGKGIGLVVKTGMGTEIGSLVSLMKGQEKVTTPLHEKVSAISKNFIKGAAIAGGLVFLAGLLWGRPLRQMITTSITLAASAIPEGLPVTITIALSAGIYRMAKQNALIRKLSALETLGRTTVICTDKTGTLTKNEMTVKRIVTIRSLWRVEGDGYQPTGAVRSLNAGDVGGDCPGDTGVTMSEGSVGTVPMTHLSDIVSEGFGNPELRQLAKIAVLCNNSKLEQEGEEWRIKGDPTEGALLALAGKFGFWQDKMTHWHRVHEVPFDSNSGTMSVVCRDSEADTDCFVFCKGSVEAILEHCSWYQQDGEVYPLTEETKQNIYRQNESFAQDALRVLGFAYCPTEWVEGQEEFESKELIYVGLVGMMDPPKPEVEASIREAYALGVTPVMITGDHPITAIAIARELGLGNGDMKVLTGQELDRLTDQELAGVVGQVSVFARVTPEHKLRIVKAYQSRGHIVAMTGDGVNDTPAIKQSNVGIAMGRTGTEVTKATADMVLKKDHFGSILEGVKEGRTIISNIRKAIGCLLTGNLAEIIVTATAVMVGLPMPLVPIQILLMNLLTDAVPAMILAVNPGRQTRQTKRQDIVDKALYQKVVTRGILLGAGSLGLFAVALGAGVPLAVAQTAAFTALVVGQLVQTLSWRQEGTAEGIGESLKDRYLVGGLGTSFLALLAAIYVPPLARFFHTAPLMPQFWLAVLLIAGSVSVLARPFLHLATGNRAPTIGPFINRWASAGTEV